MKARVYRYLLSIGSRVAASAIVGFFSVLRLFGANLNLHLFCYHTLSNRLDLRVCNDGIVFDGSTKSGASRAIRLLTKEPDTINWIENYFSPGDVFYDVGANIGVYSLYAAKKINVDVIAFEPESLSYAALNTNIFYNKLAAKIKALNLALYNVDTISSLNISNFQTGKSSHNFHEKLDHSHSYFRPAFEQTVIGARLDTLVDQYELPFPNHIKIDVDGNEHKVIEGIGKMLLDPRLRTIAIEVHMSLQVHRELIDIIESSEFVRLKGVEYTNKELTENNTPNIFFARNA